jgi:hypothetical protein
VASTIPALGKWSLRCATEEDFNLETLLTIQLHALFGESICLKGKMLKFNLHVRKEKTQKGALRLIDAFALVA